MAGGMSWPSDEMELEKKEGGLKELLKFIIAFADEALVIAIVLYLLFKYV